MRQRLSIIGLSLLSAVIGAAATAFVISKNTNTNVEIVERVVETAPQLGCQVLFVDHSGLSHRDICERGIEPKILDWLLSHKRQR